jgi:hypothetical protein
LKINEKILAILLVKVYIILLKEEKLFNNIGE